MTPSRSHRLFTVVLAAALATASAVVASSRAEARASHETTATAPVGDHVEHDGKVNINTADVKELMKLAGVHKKTAEKIVEYRQAHGLFKKPEEVVKVEGIGHTLYEKNRARIVIE